MEAASTLKARQTRLCFATTWRMRHDGTRVILYKYSTEESEWKTVPPHVALALALFDGVRSLHEVTLEVCRLLDLPLEEARKFMGRIIAAFHDHDDPVLVRTETVTDRDWPVYDPGAMIVPVGEFKPDKRLDAPLSLLLMPCNSCLVDCCYCYSERKPIARDDLLTVEEWQALIHEAADAGVDVATFSGGDPMLYPGIMPLLDALIERDFEFIMSTKAPISRDQALMLAEMGYGKRLFQISLDAWSPAVADRMVGRPGYRDQAVASIRNLVACGIKVRTNTVCTPANVRQAPELLRKLAELGVARASVTIYGRSMYRHDDRLFVAREEIDWLREQVQALREELADNLEVSFNGSYLSHGEVPVEEKKRTWQSRASCSGGISSMTICADGRVLLCEQMPHAEPYTAGNVREQGLLAVWRSERMLAVAFPDRARFEGTVCASCEEFDECHYDYGYCFRDALNAYGTIYMPPPNCPQAPPSPRFS